MKQQETHVERRDNSWASDIESSQRDDIEMSFIRTLSVKGLVLSGALSAEDRRERIRVAIFSQKLDGAAYDASMNFAQAYKLCYSRALDLRRVDRDSRQRPVDVIVPYEEDVSFDEFDDDEDEEGGESTET